MVLHSMCLSKICQVSWVSSTVDNRRYCSVYPGKGSLGSMVQWLRVVRSKIGAEFTICINYIMTDTDRFCAGCREALCLDIML